MADIFDEIDEELKQDRAKQVWARYGKYVVSAAVAVVLGVGASQGFTAWKQSQAEASADLYSQAIASDDAVTMLEVSLGDLTDGYALLGRFRIAAGKELSFRQEDVTFSGHAIECRINAEHPETFMPTPGKVTAFHAAGGSGIRVDSCLYSGYSVPPYYDSLIAKLIVHGDDRAHCLARLKRALAEFVVEPIPTTLDLHERLVDAPAVLDGSYNIRWLEEHFLSDD